MNTIYSGSVPTFALDTVRERVEKINRRAIRRGFPTVSIAVGATKVVADPYGCKVQLHQMAILGCDCVIREVEYSDVTITADAPLAMEGWRLVGVIAADAVDAAGNAVPMVTEVPGEPRFTGTINDAQYCDHCQQRRYRTETFLVANSATVRQIGRNCLRDFLGHDPAAILAGLDAFRSLVITDSERESWGASAPSTFTIDDVLKAACRIVAHDGWYISKRKAIESEDDPDNRTLTSTASQTWELLSPPRTQYEREFHAAHPYNEAAERLFNDTKTALANLKPSNDWEFKIADYAEIARVGARHVGILASAVILGGRMQERAAKVASEAAAPESKHIGTVGGKVTVEATVTFVKEFDGAYGTTTLIKFSSPDGDVQWWKSGSLYGDHPFTVGNTVTLSGTVKKHEADRFTNRPITTLTRCKVG